MEEALVGRLVRGVGLEDLLVGQEGHVALGRLRVVPVRGAQQHGGAVGAGEIVALDPLGERREHLGPTRAVIAGEGA